MTGSRYFKPPTYAELWKRFLQLLPKLGELCFVMKADFSSAQDQPVVR